jgi:predicted nucleic acid-binding Zn ribbon protein
MKTIRKKIKEILNDQRAQTESSTVFFLIVIAIVAVVLIAVVKPMFNKSVKASTKQAALPSQTATVQ